MKIMAIDLGDVRTGLSVCDRLEFLASPAGVILETDIEKIIQKIANEVAIQKIEQVVVGYPKNMNGSIGERAEKCESFAEQLQKLIGIPVILWDERSTTVSAHNFLNNTNIRGKKRKNIIDEVAATIILQSYLDYRKNHKEN
jgi:putative Holliday junction resolvase